MPYAVHIYMLLATSVTLLYVYAWTKLEGFYPSLQKICTLSKAMNDGDGLIQKRSVKLPETSFFV
jgi:hypothetical protein